MKNILTPLLLLFSTFLTAQQLKPAGGFSDSTAIGTPDGNAVSKQIGTGGGTIVSDDGRVELIFPAGALLKNTTISIQPTTNLAPNGVGKSYWFEPSGLQFKKPVQLIFHYTKEESERCPPEWMSLGVQSRNGKWTIIDYETVDSVGKKLKGFIHHFSGASNIDDLRLTPDKDELFVNESVVIELNDVTRFQDAVNPQLATVDNNLVLKQYVNTVLNGNAKEGTIKGESVPASIKNNTTWYVYQYNSPAIIPQAIPVMIDLDVSREKKGIPLLRRISCRLYIKDAYRISVIHEYTGREGMGARIIDSASFVVTISAKKRIEQRKWYTISDIQNYPPAVIKHGSRSGLKETITVDGVTGSIDIRNDITKGDSMVRAYPLEAYFELATRPVTMCKTQYKIRNTNSATVEMPGMSIPEEINFLANGQEQRYNVTLGGRFTYQLIVRPLGNKPD